jgi:hypothetical protein
MPSNEALNISFDDGVGSISNLWNVDLSTPGEVRLDGNSAMMQWAVGRDAGQGYGTYNINARFDGTEPGSAIVFWPGDNQWPGQEIDIGEMTPDGSGRQYGALHWNDGGSDAYDTVIFDGVRTGVFNDYGMVWEPGRITMTVNGEVKAVFTENVPVDFDNGGMDNTIGFLNNNPNTSLTVREVSYTPMGGEAAWVPPPMQAPAYDEGDDGWQPEPGRDEPAAEWQPDGAVSREPAADAGGPRYNPGAADPWAEFTGEQDWEAIAAQVYANYEATGYWFY